jgi:putative Mn2+ efflux pump MntP
VLALIIAALAVGFGNFGASIGIGMAGATIATRVKVGIVFGVFEAGMPLVGLLAGKGVADAIGNISGYAGGALLIAIGGWQLFQAFRASGQAPVPPPRLGRLLLTAFALSLDNLVVGFSLGAEHISIVQAVVVFAVVSVSLSVIGLEFGRRIGAVLESGAEYLAGIALMAVGLLVAVG